MPYQVTFFGSVELSVYVEAGMQSDIGTGQARHGYAQATDGAFFDNFDPNRRLPSELQPVSKSLLVVEDTPVALRDKLRILRAMLGVRDFLVISWGNNSEQWWQWARCVQVDIPAEHNQLTHAVVNLSWMTEEQHWQGVINGAGREWEDELPWWDTGMSEWDAVDPTFTLDGSPVAVELDHDGNLLQSALRTVVEVPTGGNAITAVAVANNTAGNNTLWSYAGGPSIGVGERLYVDGGERRAMHLAAAKSITSVAQAGRTSTVTVASHGYLVGDIVYMDPNAGDLSSENSGFFEITAKDTNTFSYINYQGIAETPTGAKVRKATNVRAYLTPDRVREWLSMSPGTNSLSVTYTGNSTNDATVSFKWSDHHA